MSTFDERLREAYDYGVSTAHATPACRDYLFDQWRERLAGLDPLDAIPTPPRETSPECLSGFEVHTDGRVVDRRPDPRYSQVRETHEERRMRESFKPNLLNVGRLTSVHDPSRNWIP